MKKSTKKIIRNTAIILGAIIVLLFVGKYMKLFSVTPGCDETAYSSFSWNGEILTYSGIFGVNLCGGESSSPRSGSLLTGKHDYSTYGGAPYFGWGIPVESNPNYKYPPSSIVNKYPDPVEASKNMECRVYGSTVWFGNYYGDRFSVSIPYDIKGNKVEWGGSQSGFICYVDIPPTIQEEFVRQADANGCWGHVCNMIYGSFPVVQGSAEFKIKEIAPECITPLTQTCDDGSTIIIKNCIDGKYIDTNNTCPIIQPPTPHPLWQEIWQGLVEWIRNIFKRIFGLSVTGNAVVNPGDVETYKISLQTTPPDSDYSDGTYSILYGSWALIDKNENIITQGEFEEINGTYNKQVTITVPNQLNDFAIVGVIVEYKMNYNFDTKRWETSKEEVVAKEALNIATKLPVPPDTFPIWTTIVNFFKVIGDWFRNLFK